MGALTSKPYAFTARPWELRQIEALGVGDSEGATVRVQLRGKNILRVLPSSNFKLNLDWINDRTRFSYDANSYQRLDSNFITNYKKNLNWQKLNWNTYINFFYSFVQTFFKMPDSNPSNFLKFTIFNGLHVNESLLSTYEYLNAQLGRSHLIFSDTQENFDYETDFTNYHMANFNYQDLQETNFILAIGVNLREQFPILYARIRQFFFVNGCDDFYEFGLNNNLFLDDQFGKNLGNDLNFIFKFLEGRTPLNVKYLKAKKPLILIGGVFLRHNNFFSFIEKFFKNYNMLSFNLISILRTESLGISANYHGIGLDNDVRKKFKLAKIMDQNYNAAIVSENKYMQAMEPYKKKLLYVWGDLEQLSFNSEKYDLILNRTSHFTDSATINYVKKDCLLPEPTSFEQPVDLRNIFGSILTSGPVILNENLLLTPEKSTSYLSTDIKFLINSASKGDGSFAFLKPYFQFGLEFDRFLIEYLEIGFAASSNSTSTSAMLTGGGSEFFKLSSSKQLTPNVNVSEFVNLNFSKQLLLAHINSYKQINSQIKNSLKLKVYKFMLPFNNYTSLATDIFSRNSLVLNLQKNFLNAKQKNFI